MPKPSRRSGKKPGTSKRSSSVSAAAAASPKPNYVPLKIGFAGIALFYAAYFFAGDMQGTADLSLALATYNISSRSSASSTVGQQQQPPSTAAIGTTPKLLLRRKPRRHPQFNESWTLFQRLEAEQTGRVFPSRPIQTLPPQRTVSYMKFHQGVSLIEANAGSWLQRTQDFLTMKLEDIETWEDAAKYAYHDKPSNNRAEMLRTPLDMLDFSVEHLHSWWDILKVYENDRPFETSVSKLEGFIKRKPKQVELVWKKGIAVVVFQEYVGENQNAQIDKRDKLNSIALAATIESIRRAGFGRAVVVGLQPTRDEKLAKDAFRILDAQGVDTASPVVGDMQVAFAAGSSQVTSGNVPKAALLGLRDAFQFLAQNGQSEEQKKHWKAWLGDSTQPKHWEYVYLTEYDSILQYRASSLLKLRDEVNRGTALIPHRLQPIPHESDVQGALRRDSYLPNSGDFSEVIELDAAKDTCCDEDWGSSRGPGKDDFPDCGKPWFACEFGNPELPVENREHKRVKPYKLIRLKQGTGITLISATEQARRCIPATGSVGCLVKDRPKQ